jgi:hypothetical protein
MDNVQKLSKPEFYTPSSELGERLILGIGEGRQLEMSSHTCNSGNQKRLLTGTKRQFLLSVL